MWISKKDWEMYKEELLKMSSTVHGLKKEVNRLTEETALYANIHEAFYGGNTIPVNTVINRILDHLNLTIHKTTKQETVSLFPRSGVMTMKIKEPITGGCDQPPVPNKEPWLEKVRTDNIPIGGNS